jgi:DDE superfamily endonuclease
MAKRLGLGECDQLHHFIAAGVWDAAPVETELLVQADRLVDGSDAVLVIDDTALPKKGAHSVGVAPQYASALGKTSNCQTLVSLTLARGEVPVMVALRLFLPESWTSDRARLRRAGVPAEYRTARTKPEMALAEIDRVIAAGVRFGCVLADAGYGMSAPFRQELTARKLAWAVGIPRQPQGLPCRCADDLAGSQARSSPSAARPGHSIDTGRRHAGQCPMAYHQLAHRYEGEVQGSFCRRPRAGRRRTTAADQGQGSATSARRRGLAHQRTQDVGREEILSRQPAGEDGPAHLGGHHQSAMDLRAGSPATERRTGSRPLRGTILARPPPPRAHDHDCLRFPPASPTQSSKAGKKESAGHHRNQPCQRCVRPHHRNDARTAENGFATSGGVSKSAKVVLVWTEIQS